VCSGTPLLGDPTPWREEIAMSVREVTQLYRCRCIIVELDNTEYRCNEKVNVDQPFCTNCGDRHSDRVQSGLIKAATAAPIGVQP
jgi:ribosomal protein S27AE